MSQGVAVGFSPAVVPVVTGGMTAAPPAEGEPGGGLFAALLAMIGVQPPTIEGLATAVVPSIAERATIPEKPALLFDMAKAVPVVDAEVLPQAGTAEGKALLKTLGDALVALKDCVDAGEAPDAALEHKLDDALDAVAAYLGVTLPTSQPAMPAISAQAGGAGALPEIAGAAGAVPNTAIPEPTMPSSDGSGSGAVLPGSIAAAVPASKSTILPLAATEVPLVAPGVATTASPGRAESYEIPVTEVAEALGATEVAPMAPATGVADPAPTNGATDVARATEVAGVDPTTEVAETPKATEVEPMSSAASEPVAEDVAAPIAKLAKLLDGLADKVAQQSPELAKKLEALANQLKTGKLPDAVAAMLTGEDGATPEAQLQRIIDALSAPKATPAPAVAAAQPFVVPSLDLPSTLGKADPADKVERAEVPDAADIRSAEAKPEDKPAHRARLADAPQPISQPSEHKPSSSPAANAKQETAPVQSTDASVPTPQAAAPAATAVARSVHAAYQAPVQQVNLPQVAFEVVRQFQAGNSRFQIRLDPPELGRIDVKLDVDKSGTVNARMTVERPETLDLMQRDQRALQQALQQAGLDSSRTSLEFSLRQNPFAQQQGMGDGRGQQPAFMNGGSASADDVAEVQAPTNLYRGTASPGGVNLFV